MPRNFQRPSRNISHADAVVRIFEEILADYRHGKMDADEVRQRIADAIKANPDLQKFKDRHLGWTDYDDMVMWLKHLIVAKLSPCQLVDRVRRSSRRPRNLPVTSIFRGRSNRTVADPR